MAICSFTSLLTARSRVDLSLKKRKEQKKALPCHSFTICHSQTPTFSPFKLTPALVLQVAGVVSPPVCFCTGRPCWLPGPLCILIQRCSVFSLSPPWEFPSVPGSNSQLEPQLYICECMCARRGCMHVRLQSAQPGIRALRASPLIPRVLRS